MNGGIVYKTGGRDDGTPGDRAGAVPMRWRAEPLSIALWVFIGVAGTLFSLFIVAYVLRAREGGWTPIGLPPQLWISSALLVAASAAAQLASAAVTGGRREHGRRLLLAAGAFAFAFLALQGWAWQALLSARVAPAGNAAASFFYLLTAMHGLHVAGGLVLWQVSLRALARRPASAPVMVGVCARYLHFLLAVWLALFAVLGLVTPEVARAICGGV